MHAYIHTRTGSPTGRLLNLPFLLFRFYEAQLSGCVCLDLGQECLREAEVFWPRDVFRVAGVTKGICAVFGSFCYLILHPYMR